MNYKHLSLENRYYIEVELKKGISQNKIAKSLNCNQSTVSREIARNKGQRGYRYKQAHSFTRKRHAEKTKHVKLTEDIKDHVDNCIKDDWSPEQTAGRLKEKGIISLHHETIYRYLLSDRKEGGTLYKHLRHQNKTYRKRYASERNRRGIPNRIDIDERPEAANNRDRIGDWEADTIIGKNHKGAIATIDERKSKLRLAFPLPGKKAQGVTDAIVRLLKPIEQFVKTITFDNGKEFTLHESIAKSLDCETYFAKPYHSWERGQNENANGLLRQYFPKAMELIDVTVKEVFAAVDRLNSRPRKCLGYKTPYESFEEQTGIDMRTLAGYALMT